MDTKAQKLLALQFHYNELKYEHITAEVSYGSGNMSREGAQQLCKGRL